jgi:TP901 family phage tail tape measure protein
MATLTSRLIVALVDQVTGPARAVRSSIDRLNAAQARNNARLDAMRGRMVEAGAVAYGLARAVAAPVRSAMSLESAMADVAKVSGFDDAGLADYTRQLRRLAVTEIPMAVEELAALSANAAQAGVADADLFDFTRITAKAALAWEMTGADAGEALAKIRTQLNLTNDQVRSFADAINHLSDKSASSAADLVEYTRRVAAQGEFFGFSKEQTLAFGSAMIGAGAEAEIAATSFRNMGKSLSKGTSATSKQTSAFEALGLNAVKTATRMQVDAVGTVIDVIERIGQLPAHLQATTMFNLFGEEARALTPLIGRIDILREALGLVADETAYAGSVSREFARRAATTEFAVQRFKNQLNELGITVGSALLPALNDMMAAIGPMISRVAALAEAYPGLTRAVVATTAGLVALRIAALAAQFSFLWMKGGLIAAAILGLRSLLPAMTAVTTAARVMRIALLSTGIGAIVVALGMGGAWIASNWEGVKIAFEAFAGAFTRAIEPIRPMLDPLIAGIGAVWDKVSALVGPIDEMGGRWAAAGIAAGKFAGDIVVWMAELPGRIATAASGIGGRISNALNEAVTAVRTKADEIKTRVLAVVNEIPGLARAIADGLYDVGVTIMQRLLDGIVAKAAEVMAWFQALPGRIKAAIGSIDLGSIINWPTPPAWLSRLWGGGGGITEQAAAANSGGGGTARKMLDGMRASGGPVRAGGAYLVGEYGPEIVTFAKSGFVHDAQTTSAMMASPRTVGDGAGQPVSRVIHMGGVKFEIQAAPGQSVQQIADAVERRLSDKLNALLGGAYSDGVA